MKRILSLILVLALAISCAAMCFAANVCRSTQKLSVDGSEVSCVPYNIDGYNYFRLRDLAAAFAGTESRFNVAFDASANAMIITTGVDYEEPEQPDVWNGVFLPFSPTPRLNPVQSAQTLIVDGTAVKGLSVWNIDGYNYFKLAELQSILGYRVTYNEATRTMEVVTGAAPAPALSGSKSYAEVYAAISSVNTSRGYGVVYTEEDAAPTLNAPAEEPAAPAPATDASKSADSAVSGYSGTNVQVEGIDEGDIVKTDGKYIYVLRDGGELVILRADGKKTAVVSRTEIGGYTDNSDAKNEYYSSKSKYPREMYVSGGRLAILSDYYDYEQYKDASGWHYENEEYTCVDFYNVSDPAAPKLLTALGQDGYSMGSRMKDGKLYVITNYYVWDCDADDPMTYVPVCYTNGTAKAMPADCVIIAPECTSSRYAVVCAYDLSAGTLDQSLSLLGCAGDELYMSENAVYLLGSTWENEVVRSYSESIYTVTEYLDTSETRITRIDLGSEMCVSATGSVPGYIDNQFSADEFDGCLRIVTTRDDSSYSIYNDAQYGFQNYRWGDNHRSNGLYILNASLDVIGSVENLAEDERVYSVRFDGSIAYFCTYRQTDPLFAVDVSDPTAPQVLSALKLSGFSEYLHAWGSDRLFGFGRETNEETGWNEGLKLVMFDTADKTDVTVENYLVLDESYSEALYNHKAFFIDQSRNIIGFLGGDDDYYVFSYTPEDGFQELTHFWFDTFEWNVRGLWIGDWAYIIGNEEAMLIDMTTWAAPTLLKIS